mgnify:CR=1 FL=1
MGTSTVRPSVSLSGRPVRPRGSITTPDVPFRHSVAEEDHPACLVRGLLSRVLHEADLAKFAAFGLSEERARALARDAKGIVERDHTASQPILEAAA